MWMGEVARKVWMRGRSAAARASAAASMSFSTARASAAIVGPFTWPAMSLHPSNWCGEEMGKPASITSTPSRASCTAISSFCSTLIDAPGDCSPSRSVVSKMNTRSTGVLLSYLFAFFARSIATRPLRAISTIP